MLGCIRAGWGGGSPSRSAWPPRPGRGTAPGGSPWPGTCGSTYPPPTRCWAAGRSANTSPNWSPTETSHLDPELRRHVDQQLVAAGLDQMGPKQAAAAARKLAYQADPAGSLDRGRTARKDRRVTCRPAPDTMSLLNALLPVEQGVACYAALKTPHRHRQSRRGCPVPGPDHGRHPGRTAHRTSRRGPDQHRDQPDHAPRRPDRSPATRPRPRSPGTGPIPGWLARQLAASNGPARRWWRRLFTTPSPRWWRDDRRR